MSGEIELPKDYAPRRVRERLAPWWRGAAGEAVRRYGPAIWPGVPPTALLAWSITSTGPDEMGPGPDFVRGLWGVEQERVDELARDARPYLGREVRTEMTSRGYLGDIEGQCVCGLLGYRRHFEGVVKDVTGAVARELRERRDGPAAWRVAAMAYSSGGGAVEPLLDGCAHLLVGQPQEKWGPILADVVATTGRDRIEGRHGRSVRVRGKWRAAYMLLRVEARALGAVGLAAEVLGPGEATAVRKWVGDWAADDAYAARLERLRELANA